jgi:fumarate reductase flavoprotein subunit
MADFEFSVPVLIAGAGACGAAAALAARDAGVEVLVIEQDATPHGTTSMSQGLVCAAGTKAQAAAGIEDDVDTFFNDILVKTRGETDHRLARVIADEAGRTVDWLVEAHDVPYGLDLGFRAAYGHSRQRIHGWRGHGGEDVLGLLHARLGAAGVDVLPQAKLVEVFADATGQVVGVEIERPDGERERIGCGALVMAMGGYGGNPELVGRWMPEAAHAWYNGHEGSHGDAVRLGEQLGAALGDMGSYQGYGMLTDPQGISVPPGVLIEGGILVNTHGKRFIDESADIAGVVHPVLGQPGGTAWVIYDDRIDTLCAYIPETIQLNALNAPKSAADAAGLAQAIGVDPANLAATLDEAQTARREGRADIFGRSWSGTEQPPGTPLRALKVRGALYHTQGGLQVDAQARVLRPDGRPIAGLYAGGGSARGVSGPSYWGYLPAMGICAALTLGRIAGGEAAALNSHDLVRKQA